MLSPSPCWGNDPTRAGWVCSSLRDCHWLPAPHTTDTPFFPGRVPSPVLIKKFSDASKAFMGIVSSQACSSSTSALRWVSSQEAAGGASSGQWSAESWGRAAAVGWCWVLGLRLLQ